MVACARFFGYNNRRPEKRNYRYEENHSSRRSRRRVFGVGPTDPEPDAGDCAAGTGSCSCARAACAGRAAAGSCPAAGRATCGAAGHDHYCAACAAGHYHHGAARPAGHNHHGGARNDSSGACANNRCSCGLSDLPPLRRPWQGGACDGFQTEALQALRRQGLPAAAPSSASSASSSPSPPPALS